MKRKDFVTAIAATSAGLMGVAGADAAGIPGGTNLVERRREFDEATFDRILGRPARIRQVWESIAIKAPFLSNVKNSMNGLIYGFGYAPADVMIVSANHGPSSAYTYGDSIWSKYRIAEFISYTDPKTRVSPDMNPFYARKSKFTAADPDDEHGMYQDSSIEALQARGVVFLTCHTAVQEQSRALVTRGFAPKGMTHSDVAADILTHLIPNAVVVPSMVATLAVLQARFHYTYASVQS